MSTENLNATFQGDFETTQQPQYNKRQRESLGANESPAKKTKDYTAAMNTTTNDELKDLLMKLHKDLSEKQNNFQKSLDEVQKNLQQQLTMITEKIQVMEGRQVVTSTEVQQIRVELNDVKHDSRMALNKIEQNALERNVIGYGIPAVFAEKKDELVDKIGKKLQIPLDLSAFESIRAQNNKKEITCTFFFKFRELHTKTAFMSAIDKLRKKDVLIIEDIFPEYSTTNQAGKWIAFRNQITKGNQKILEAAKKRIEIKFAWERNGKIWLRRKEGERAIEALSIEHVNYTASSH